MAQDINSGELPSLPSMPCLAKVVSHMDTTYMGGLKVELLKPIGNDSDTNDAETQVVKMLSPFFGATPIDFVGESTNDYDNSQKSYGMWFVPPDIGTLVLVIFVNGDPAKGYWIGCVPDKFANFMVPGIASTEFNIDGGDKIPVSEYNKTINDVTTGDETKQLKPRHIFADTLESQGLLKDDIRGTTSSSARREVPSAVFGISTPGPVDKRENAPKKDIVVSGETINMFGSRLGGTTFVMDDGDDKFLRKTAAGDGPPEYLDVVQGDAGGDPAIPHNELVRIRTRTGHQILFHNSEDLIYITNSRGTAWIELTSNGKIDIFSQDSISVHTGNDINFTAVRDINFTAGNNINLNAVANINETATKDLNLYATGNSKLTSQELDIVSTNTKWSASSFDLTSSTTKISVGSLSITGSGGIKLTGPSISLNGPAGSAASAASAAQKALVTARRPQTEPWDGHENLDPVNNTPEKTVAVEEAPTSSEAAPQYFSKSTIPVDAFRHLASPTPEEQQ